MSHAATLPRHRRCLEGRGACRGEAAAWPQLQTSPPERHVQPSLCAASPTQPAPRLTYLLARSAGLEARGTACDAGQADGQHHAAEQETRLAWEKLADRRPMATENNKAPSQEKACRHRPTES